MGTPEGEERFETVITENFPKLSVIKPQIQGAQRTPNRINTKKKKKKKTTPWNTMFELQKIKDKLLEEARGNKTSYL